MDEVGDCGALIGVHANVSVPAVVPGCVRAVDVGAWCPALIAAERGPEPDQLRLGAHGLSERLLEAGVGEIGVRRCQKADEVRLIAEPHDPRDGLRRRAVRLGAQVAPRSLLRSRQL